ncbi:MAG: class I SAM-dependent methyltransferase [Myxococcota bacterium]|jgi:SAM-dependent methyltransferase
MTDLTFTGERLHEGNPLFGVDLARHHAAYRFAIERAPGVRVLDLGSGSGYGTAALAGPPSLLVGLDRVHPDAGARVEDNHFVRGDLNAMPLASDSFDLIVSFQVIEHLEDPTLYLEAMSRLLRPDGLAVVTTPNLLTSDRENPYHVHEYEGLELAKTLGAHFADVEMLGVGMSEAAARYHEARLARIRRITRLDPLRLRHRIPEKVVEWLFAQFALVVRRGIQRDEGLPEVDWSDFPVAPYDASCVDLLAVCRQPRG